VSTPRIFASDIESVSIAVLPDDTTGCLLRFRGHASALEVVLPVETLERLVHGATGLIPLVKRVRVLDGN
jgi:hypothetical protein